VSSDSVLFNSEPKCLITIKLINVYVGFSGNNLFDHCQSPMNPENSPACEQQILKLQY
jgi:hypothetical protein